MEETFKIIEIGWNELETIVEKALTEKGFINEKWKLCEFDIEDQPCARLELRKD